MHDDIGEVLITAEQIQVRVRELGEELRSDYQGRSPLCIGILRGAIMFLADLIRACELELQIDFIAVASYGSSTRSSGVVRILKDLDEDIKDRDVILIEDILDTGLTLNYLLKNLKTRHPASIEICALLVKEGKQKVTVQPKYKGFDIEDRFVVGYGLDLNEKYRNLPYIGTLKPELLDIEYT
ncbi:MAG: hypoxanthine phosphoribosyltransferase [Actinomycetota bacterium]|nr:hypoxanthine phosphoribosyltransferase [Actinomycetota bacterium]